MLRLVAASAILWFVFSTVFRTIKKKIYHLHTNTVLAMRIHALFAFIVCMGFTDKKKHTKQSLTYPLKNTNLLSKQAQIC